MSSSTIRASTSTISNQQTVDNNGTKSVYECILGARETNEDKFNSFSVENEVGFFCVHDGHSGIDAVEHMQKSMALKWNTIIQPKISLNPAPPALISRDPNVTLLATVYNDAIRDLQKHESGVVSITAMSVGGKAIYLAWVGDCEGCIFYNDNPSLKTPIVKKSECFSLDEVDFAELNNLGPNIPAISPFIRENCASSPHSLSGDITFQIPPLQQIKTSHIQNKTPAVIPEDTQLFLGVVPIKFQYYSALKEFQLAKLFNDSSSSRPTTTLDVATSSIGNTQLTLDVRFSGAIQPTRSLGDFSPVNYSIIRHPTVMRALIPPQTANSCSILLCSDGVFSGHAFKGIEDICRFVINPIAFFQESFYFRGQVLTERLIAARLLPQNTLLQSNQVTLFQQWKHSCKTWPQILSFLRINHWRSITSSQMAGVLEPGSIENYRMWLKACDISIKYLEAIPNFDSSMQYNAAFVGAHLAVIMGSSDNVTLVIAKAF